MEEIIREREERLRGWEVFFNVFEVNRGFRRLEFVCVSERVGFFRVRYFLEYFSIFKMNV